MAKVFISVLGTNNYVPCSYMYRDQIVIKETRFVQEATVSLCCRDWSDKDRILIFTTDEAEKKNWLDDGHCDCKTRTPIKQQGLKTILEALKLKPKVTNVKIPEGESEKQIWEIFQAIFDNLHQGDEIVFDITHAFRSIPMLVMVVLSYAKVIKSVTLTGIYYGALEVLGNPRDVSKMPLDKRKAPIFDLTEFDRLLDWTTAVDRFVSSGDASLTAQLAQGAVRDRLKMSRGADVEAKAVRKLAKLMNDFTTNIAACRGKNISRSASDLIRQIDSHGNSLEKVLPAITPLLKSVRRAMEGFVGDEIKDGIAAARWCKEHNLIQQGFTILTETLVSYLVNQVGDDFRERTNRQRATSSIEIFKRKLPKDKWEGPAASDSDKTRKFLDLFNERPDLANFFTSVYGNFKQYRDDINHGGFRANAHKSEKFELVLSDILHQAEQFFATKSITEVRS